MLHTEAIRLALGHAYSMSLIAGSSPVVRQAREAAARAAEATNVHVVDEHDLDKLRDVESLLVAIWGMSPHGAPIPLDLLRSISHAGCNVSAAYNTAGTLCGAAVAIVSPGGAAMYSLIAGVLPGIADRAIGFALKQHQRAWALCRGIETMTWTFDPLVSRNARFNLTKLGAVVSEYVRDFYGPMGDAINANDVSDRLVAVWPLASARSVDCSEGVPEPVELPAEAQCKVLELGPDSQPALLESGRTLWCRAPADIAVLRATDPVVAGTWRAQVRGALESAFASGHIASGVTRTGWYRLTKESQN